MVLVARAAEAHVGQVTGQLREYLNRTAPRCKDVCGRERASAPTLQLVEDFVLDHGLEDTFLDWLESRLVQEAR